MNFKNNIPVEAKYSKRNTKIQTIWFIVALILWGGGTYLLWNEKSRFVSLSVFAIIITSAVNYYVGWKKYKNKQEA
ncbi:hypothetical protein A9P82_13365 [Arachidicoccus ginsenosidimutans]|uniref:hypothetical protein n=1 Tax=Arachidicoccus sp. BS20 TaxID=1850526 RepID=UPI0007F1857B|nr:hypothetical protein [Arachidicoccus sp. BS20]ANI90189.1 hypothetical protein A9P82_13365 [Arachidicoccus sp. BS20]